MYVLLVPMYAKVYQFSKELTDDDDILWHTQYWYF